jgi:isopentenyl diphosphate isomerase/L-lactate dehydrogenase-like FMN-dependent dehydrogenase
LLKVVALGGKGVSIGRPVLFSQACYGAAGVQRLYDRAFARYWEVSIDLPQVFKAEVERGMALNGVVKLSELDATYVELMDGLLGKRFER